MTNTVLRHHIRCSLARLATRTRFVSRGMLTFVVAASAAFLSGAQAFALQVSPGAGGFVQTDTPSVEQIPAAPLLIAAYAIAWVLVFFFVWTVWRRLSKVDSDLRALEKRQSQRGR